MTNAGVVTIADDAVTNDKLDNGIVSAIAANTAKVSNATHTGDVTGSTALTIGTGKVTTAKIADDAVTADKLADSYAPTVHTHSGDSLHPTHCYVAATGYIGVWGFNSTYSIRMYDEANHHYGDVTSYSMKFCMSDNPHGFTWGPYGTVPTASLTVSGKFETAGAIKANGGFIGALTGATVNATTGYQRSGTAGYIYVPLTGSCSSATIDAKRNVGSYLCDMSDFTFANTAEKPDFTEVKAWYVQTFAKWPSASTNNWCALYVSTSSTVYSVINRASTTVGGDGEGIVQANANGDFYLEVSGANMSVFSLSVLGYFI
jgi:hypothetical protein